MGRKLQSPQKLAVLKLPPLSVGPFLQGNLTKLPLSDTGGTQVPRSDFPALPASPSAAPPPSPLSPFQKSFQGILEVLGTKFAKQSTVT